ncbi:PIG-L family deacetylase [Kineococcus sp. SYSU DK004]|uniref:PIG-L family deacetylase n=1 Tax=Kineococcus sp. SYSU DK004 TaxID=3383125 RepID=UPI003D7C4F83
MAAVSGGAPGAGVPEFTASGPGTSAARWSAWPWLHELPEVDLTGLEHLVVVAAHPDDETLGAGGLVATAADAGARVDVVVATDGDASHPCSPTHPPARLARLRAEEVRRAVAVLDPAARVHHLGLPDGALTAHVDAVTAAVTGLLAPAAGTAGTPDAPGALVVGVWTGDGHPDHAAAGEAAGRAAAAAGARLLHHPVWAWHWAEPGDARLPWARALRLPLPAPVLERKRSALAEHVSQVAPLSDRPGDEVLLPPRLLEHFTRPAELFFAPEPSPAADDERAEGTPVVSGTLGAAWFEDFYARHDEDPWGVQDRWYEQRKRALLLACLPRQRFRRTLEVGCSTGVLTAELAARSDRLLACDASASVVERARARLAADPPLLPGGQPVPVEVVPATVPGQWPASAPGTAAPEERYDLVVLSEVAYYCDHADLRRLAALAAGALAHDGVLVACHWRHRSVDQPVTGDEVHRVLRAEPGLEVLVSHVEEDFLLDVLVPVPAVSVARAGGLVP